MKNKLNGYLLILVSIALLFIKTLSYKCNNNSENEEFNKLLKIMIFINIFISVFCK